MAEGQDSKQNQIDDISTSAKVGLTAFGVCAISGFLLVMTSCEKDGCRSFEGYFNGLFNQLFGLIMMGTSPVVGCVAAGASELSLFAHKKIVEIYNKDEPLTKLKTP